MSVDIKAMEAEHKHTYVAKIIPICLHSASMALISTDYAKKDQWNADECSLFPL